MHRTPFIAFAALLGSIAYGCSDHGSDGATGSTGPTGASTGAAGKAGSGAGGSGGAGAGGTTAGSGGATAGAGGVATGAGGMDGGTGGAATGAGGASTGGRGGAGGGAGNGGGAGRAGSGGGPDGGSAGGDGGTSGDGGALIDLDEIMTFQKDLMKKLTGAEAWNGTDKMSDRSTASNRKMAREYIASLYKSFGLEPKVHEYATDGANPYVELLSTTGSTEWLIVGGHFDTVKVPGADDDGSGTVLQLTVAKYLAKQTARTKNVMIAAFDQEESGLVGSKAMAKWIKNDRKLKVHSVHCFDMIGWDADKDRVLEMGAEFHPYYSKVNDALGLGMKIPTYYGAMTAKEFAGTDSSAFSAEGFNATNIGEEWGGGDTTPNYHKATDTWDTIHYDYLAASTRLVIYTITDLSQ